MAEVRPVRESLQEYGRGLAGGLLFSLPLLYTMEVWWTGLTIPPGRVLIWLAVMFGLLLGYNYYAGIRKDDTLKDVLLDSVEEVGLGLLLAAFILGLFHRFPAQMSLPAVLGQVAMEGMLVAVGVSVGTAQMGSGEKGLGCRSESRTYPLLSQVVLALCGAVLVGSTVAPTDEILLMAAEMHPGQLLGAALLSLGVCAGILFFLQFQGADRHIPESRTLAALAPRLLGTYGASVLASAFLLWMFGRFDGLSLYPCAAQVAVLGLPCAMGASAGRLLVQGGDQGDDEDKDDGPKALLQEGEE